MKFEKKLFNLSLPDTFLYFGLICISGNILIFIVTLVEDNPGVLYGESSWFVRFILPFIMSIIQNLIYRKWCFKHIGI